MTKRARGAACPCASGAPYVACCRPVHVGARDPDPPSLVRARLSAFARGDDAFLWATLHPSHRSRSQPEGRVRRSLRRARETLRYRGVEVQEVREVGDEAQVLFVARVFEGGRDRSFQELSDFRRGPSGWAYVEGLTGPAKEPAPTIEAFFDGLGSAPGVGPAGTSS